MKSKICIGLAVFATVLAYPNAAWAAVTFASAVHYGAGSKPDSVAIGDLNGDGKLDLATANTASNNVSVLLGNGNGTFAAAVNYAAGAGAGSVVIRDLNADNKLDLVTANTSTGANSVSVLLGNGNGTFAAAVLYPVGTKPAAVAVGDLNGDNKPDLAAANGSSNNVSVLLGNGNGTFAAAVNYDGIAGAAAIAIGDLNNDNKADLITANPVSTRLVILLGNGDGTFGPMSTPYGGDYPLSLALADLNGDGKLDVVVANVTNNTVGVLLGNGSGGVGNPANYAAGNGPVGVAISDLDGDGKLDLAAANQRGDSVSVLLGNGNGSFAAATTHAAGDGPLAVAIADFDGDGLRDVATANVNSNNVSVLSNATVVPFATGPTATISGTAKVGQTLTAGEGTPDPTQDSFEYQWHADGADIGSATAKTLVLTTAQLGKKISVTVTAKKAGYSDAADTSDETAAVTADFTTGPTATISGTTKVGQTLTAGEGTPDPTQDSFEYQWHADGTDIGSATAKTLVLTTAQLGKKISVTVTAKKAGYSDAADTSDETAAVTADFATGPTATISGTAKVGETLTAGEGTPDPTQDSFEYQWHADGVDIGSATNNTLVLTTAQLGKKITVTVTAKKAGYTDATDTSDETAVVTADFATGPTATIDGAAKVGQTLTAGEGTPDPTQDSFEYQWHADGTDIGSATAKTLVLGADQVGKKISVTVTAKKAGYTDAIDTSDETATVVGVFDPGPTATITGTVRIGSTLTAHRGSVSPTPGATTYRWYADGKQISGATSSKFKPAKAQVGKRITVRVYVSKAGYVSADDLSDPTPKVSGLAAKHLDLEPDQDTVKVGQKVSPVEIKGLSNGETWTLYFDKTKLKSGTASTKGTVRTYYVVPKTTKGKHTLKVTGRYADRYDTDTLKVK